MKITVPDPKPFAIGRVPFGGVTPTLGQTGNAQYSRTFGPVIEGNKFYTSQSEYDPDSVDRVERYIEQNGMSDRDARYLRAYGIGSEDNFYSAVDHLKKQRQDEDVLGRSSGLNFFLTDPAVHLSLAIPYSVAASVAGINRAMFAAPMSRISYPRELLTAKQIMRGEATSAEQLAKIGAIEGALVDGSLTMSQALSEVGISDNESEDFLNASILAGGMSLMGGALGYTLGAVAGAPLRSQQRMSQFSENYKTYLNSVSDDPVRRGEDLSYAGSWFTNTPAMKVVPSPVRTEIQDPAIPERFKQQMLDVGGDNGMLFAANQAGKSVGNSVFIEAGRRQGDWFRALDVIDQNYRKVSPRGQATFLNVPVGAYVEKARKMMGKDSFAPEDWYTRIGDLYVRNVPYEKMTPEEASSVQALESFFQKYESELSDVGLIRTNDFFVENYLDAAGRQGQIVSVTNSIIAQNKRWMGQEIAKINKSIDPKRATLSKLDAESAQRGLTAKQIDLQKKLRDELGTLEEKLMRFEDFNQRINNAGSVEELASLYDKLDLTPAMREGLEKLGKAFDDTKAKIDGYMEAIEFKKGQARPRQRYFPRFFNRRKIEEDREAFKGILMKWYRQNPETYSMQKDGSVKLVKMPTDPESLSMRADQTIETILGETDEDAVDAIFTGFGRSSSLLSRRLDIPNELVSDYIIRDAKEVMIAYTSRVAPKLEFHKRVRHPETGKLITLEEHLSIMRKQMLEENVPERKIDRFIKNYVAVYDQVVGTNRKRPDALDTRAADVLRTATSWTFLGGSGVAALGDAASLFMDHELKTIGTAFLGMMDDVSLGMAKRELNLAGEALEIVMGTTHLRYLESLTNDMFSKGIPDKLNNAFYTLNGLGPVTIAMKSMDALLRGHTIIEASEKFLAGKATKFEKEFLARYNISEDMMRRFAEMPTEKSQGGLRLPNTEKWADEEAVIAFRNALRSGVMNRIIMGTPADKPIVMGGVAYIPDSVARMIPFNLPIDPRVPGYRRVESGLLALPFTFYTYTMGALSKITANHAAGAVRNRMTHIAVAMGLGAMIVNFRTPSWAWDKMDAEDKIMRAFDFSGLAAIYSDATYRAIAMASELGFEPNFPIQPKFAAPPDTLGAVVSLGGAPADWAYGVSSAVADMLSGNYSDGAKGLVRHTPLIGAMALGGILKETAMDIAGQLPNRQ